MLHWFTDKFSVKILINQEAAETEARNGFRTSHQAAQLILILSHPIAAQKLQVALGLAYQYQRIHYNFGISTVFFPLSWHSCLYCVWILSFRIMLIPWFQLQGPVPLWNPVLRFSISILSWKIYIRTVTPQPGRSFWGAGANFTLWLRLIWWTKALFLDTGWWMHTTRAFKSLKTCWRPWLFGKIIASPFYFC